MKLDIPLDLPSCSFIEQLTRLEIWAGLQPGTLVTHANELAEAWGTTGELLPVIIRCLGTEPWHWPAYEAYAESNGRLYNRNKLKDMAEHMYSKYRSNRQAIYRKHQMDRVKHLRPYWEFSGRCASPELEDDNALFVLNADDDYWESACVPWRCENLHCQCRVDSLSEFEYRNM